MKNEPAPPSSIEAVLEVYKRDVDRTLLRENLRLTPEQRLRKLFDFLRAADRVRDAGRRAAGG